MFENLAAIDIGSSSIKVVTVRTGLKNFQVKNFIYEDFTPEEGNKYEIISRKLSKIINENELKKYKILMNLPMQRTIIRNLKFPFSDKDKIAEVLPFEAEEILPFNLKDVIMDFELIKDPDSETNNVLLAVAPKQEINQTLSLLKDIGISPATMGLEAYSIFECYRYFNKIKDENIIQLDIGNEKTIINIIRNNDLLFTRSISLGAGSIFTAISKGYKISYDDTVKLFEEYNFDLNSHDNNLHKDFPKRLKITKKTVKNIYDKSIEKIYELIEQINLTRKASLKEYPDITFNRILISGGGSNINGIGSVISKEMDLPVVSLPFLEEYTESKIKSQFPLAFGILLSYMNNKYSSISFLKDEFLPAQARLSMKQYYLAAAFVILTIIVLLINLITTSFIKSESEDEYKELLLRQFKKYFHNRQISDDPVKEAANLLSEEKKEFESIDSLVHLNKRIIDTLKDILSFFPEDESFDLRNLVINESVIRLDGTIESSIKIDEFKNKLIGSNKFDNVTLNTNIKKGNEVRFSMTIKLKVSEGTKRNGK